MVKPQIAILFLATFQEARGSISTTEPPVPLLIGNVSNKVCNGKQTERQQCDNKACSNQPCRDCVWTEWSAWENQDGCNGLAVQARTVKKQNNECGAPCVGPFRQTKAVSKPAKCNDDNQDCTLTSWTMWSACLNRLGQTWRSHAVAVRAHGTGTGCGTVQAPLALNRTDPCGHATRVRNCTWADWGDYTPCSKACGGGWRSRYRRFAHKSTFLGVPCTGKMNNFDVCNTQACAAPLPCKWTEWNDWAGCDVTDQYQMVRRRSMETSVKDSFTMHTCHTWSSASSTGCPPNMIGRPKPKQIACPSNGCDTDTCCMVSPCVATFFGCNDLASAGNKGVLTWDQCKTQASDVGLSGGATVYFGLNKPNVPKQNDGGCQVQSTKPSANGTTCQTTVNNNNKYIGKGSSVAFYKLVCSNTTTSTQNPRRLATAPNVNGVGSGSSTSRLPCNGTTRETKPCDTALRNTVDCTLTSWSEWDPCTKTCEGGQQQKVRTLLEPPKYGGKCDKVDLILTQACKEGPCDPSVCKYTTWSTWAAVDGSPCSQACGPGTQRRFREVDLANTKQEEGGCTGAIKEIQPCETAPCKVTHCVWSGWQDWSGCTASCGGGTKRRNQFITSAPTNGAVPCAPEPKAMVTSCYTQPCPSPCIDGRWKDWSGWSPCTKSCGGAYKSRHRTVAVASTPCGKPVNGSFDEFMNCSANPTCADPVNCELSTWGQWSACSSSCFGIREKHRRVFKFADSFGIPCDNGVLKIVEGCNPEPGARIPHTCDATPPHDCVLEAWSEWTSCPVTCGGGQEYRQRHILTPPSHNGKPCTEAVGATRPCRGRGQGACIRDCVDCYWSQWSQWGDCSSCSGQKWRTRNVMDHANYCGKTCLQKNAKETMSCTGSCDSELFCSWTPWTIFEPCDSGQNPQCGPTTQKSQRTLHLTNTPPVDASGKKEPYFFKGTAPLTCSGTQFNNTACPLVKCPASCVQSDCDYHGWSDWHYMRCTGLAKRHRQMATVGRCGGEICKGNLIESKAVPDECATKQDCKWNPWGSWTPCHSAGQQSHRARAVFKMPQMGGAPCNGTLVETKPCTTASNVAVPCEWQDWFPWSHCSQSCGVGWQMRNRANIEAINGGATCNGVLKQLQVCDLHNDQACGLSAVGDPCKFDDWTDWSMCLATGQRNRVRHIVTMARFGSPACNGTLEELGSCGPGQMDCVVSQWTPWDKCDVTCGVGQQQRNRQLNQPASGGGIACDMPLVMTRACSNADCSQDNCEMTDWSTWSVCGQTCGFGQSQRSREIAKNRGDDGFGCAGNLHEYMNCTTGQPCGVTDCVWGDWGAWGACSETCDGGEQTRIKGFVSHATRNGQPCPVETMAEGQGCNAHSCVGSCVDGAFAEWSTWSACSTTCMGGIRHRARQVTVRANYCGTQVNGSKAEVVPCWTSASCFPNKIAVDCVLNEWTEWGSCSSTCQGMKWRSRTIKTPGVGSGAFCAGSLTEQTPCNPEAGGTLPMLCPTGVPQVDCVQSEWSPWGGCSLQCGGGQQMRGRTITQPPSLGGDLCPHPHMRETQGCNPDPCATQEKDCAYSDWSPFTGCDACKGQSVRSRTVTQHPTPQGKPCNASVATEETVPCLTVDDVRDCPNSTHYCVWSEWGTYGQCATASGATCGAMYKLRTRHMMANTTPPDGYVPPPSPTNAPPGPTNPPSPRRLDAVGQPAALLGDSSEHDAQAIRLRRLAMSFASGGATVGLFMFAVRHFGARKSATGQQEYSRSPTA